MFVPFHDDNHLRLIRFPYVTAGIVGVNVLVWLFFVLTGESGAYLSGVEVSYGLIPAVVNDYAYLPVEYVRQPETFSYLTYAFLHLDGWHLLGNMMFLWVFGDNVEDAFGHVRFLLFYMLCAVVGAAAHALSMPQSEATLMGASGAVSGVVVAYLLLHPRVWIWVLAFGRLPLRLPAWILLVLWIFYQFTMLVLGAVDVSYGAHAGGILAGALLTLLLRRPGVPLFGPAPSA
ncbi:hypothetical protein ASG43_13785 [Aureimonas sp. Leaf454]|uniref:rhomboid family intramembrane serine protease n=1 Tax=Aureimonas sp. Leaf454 TaxID=1736381 RepID=UPI0006FC52B0|nr:rhomboid family intramembrane serine protease [Aureimonas sp. Leaf454]KQT44419.1 hypothetical protein ASG43_13785 [Aureimonas sp. Leaf454]